MGLACGLHTRWMGGPHTQALLWAPRTVQRQTAPLLPPTALSLQLPALRPPPTTQPQIFVPVYDVAAAQELASVLWATGELVERSGFETVADMALACAVLGEVDDAGVWAGGRVGVGVDG